MRPGWDSYFLNIAQAVAERSTCNRLKVGSVIVQNNRIISTGYNGAPATKAHCIEEGCLKNSQGRCIRCVHAEQNAIMFADSNRVQGSTIYVTHFPCETCSKFIAQSGISRVVYKEPYANEQSNYFLEGIEVCHAKEEATI